MATYPSDRACFVACYAESVGHSAPCGWYMPQGPLTPQDIDALMPHFLYSTPRSVVMTKFLASVGYQRAYGFVIDADPLVKIRTDLQWMAVLNILLKLMALDGSLKWGVLDENDGHPPRVVFSVDDDDEEDDGNGGSIDSDVSSLTDEVAEWWDSD